MKKPKTARYKKIKTEKVADLGNYEMVKDTYKPAADGPVKVRMMPPIKVKLK